MNEPTYTLNLPQSVAMMCLQLLRKLPLEQAEQPYAVLASQIEHAELTRQRLEREQWVAQELEIVAQRHGAHAPCADCEKKAAQPSGVP